MTFCIWILEYLIIGVLIILISDIISGWGIEKEPLELVCAFVILWPVYLLGVLFGILETIIKGEK